MAWDTSGRAGAVRWSAPAGHTVCMAGTGLMYKGRSWRGLPTSRPPVTRKFLTMSYPSSLHALALLLRWPTLCAVGVLTLLGCAATGSAPAGQPTLYPNAAYKSMGSAAAEQRVQECMALANQQGIDPQSDNSQAIASGATKGAAVAGVAGAVGSAVFGRGGLENAVKRGAQSAVVGAAAGGTRGALSQHANPTYRHFVQRCLGEKGLDVIGWQ